MKHLLLKAAAPFLAASLAFSFQAHAASPTKAELQALEKRVTAINERADKVIDSAKNSSASQQHQYVKQLDSLLYQSRTASQQTDQLAERLGGDTLETVNLENMLNTTAAQILETQEAVQTPSQEKPDNYIPQPGEPLDDH